MRKDGFTLVELLAVIMILAVIALIAIFSVNAILGRARVDNDVNLVRQVLNAGRSFHEEYLGDSRMRQRPEVMNSFTTITPEVATTLTNNFFNNCEVLPNLTTANYHEENDNFRRSLHRMNFNDVHEVRRIDTNLLISHGLLRQSLFDGTNLDFNSCDSMPVVVIVSRTGTSQYTYTIARAN